MAWSAKAEFVSKYFSKGKPILVSGRLENRAWNDKNGNKRVSTEIIAEEISFVGSTDSSAESKPQPYTPSAYTSNSRNFEEIEADGSLPF